MKKLYFTCLLCMSFFYFQPAKVHGQTSNAKDDKKKQIIAFHTRLTLASPNYTFPQADSINYDYTDVKTSNVGAGLKVQCFNAIYGEYALLYNFYKQTTSQLMLGVETPSKGIRLGVRYVFSNNQFMPIQKDAASRDLQMYLTLGGAKGGLELALGNLNELLSPNKTVEPIALTDVKVRLNIALWSSSK